MNTFVDLFAGIGGFRLGFEKSGFECVFSCEIDEHARKVYELNFGDKPYGDITKLNEKQVPDCDVITAGFPCQPFSVAGEKKGFMDTRGTLFFEIERIAKEKKPKVIVLENVKHLQNHDKGRTLKTIIHSLEKIGYTLSWKVLNAKDFGVPQNRERIFIIGSLNGIEFDFSKLKKQKPVFIKDILEENGDFEYLDESEYTIIKNPKIQKSGLIFIGYKNKNIRKKGIDENKLHLSRAHRQHNRIYDANGIFPTLPSQESSGRFYIYYNGKVRKLTIKECLRLMGFPDNFKLVGSKAKIYNRIGNSVVVPLVEEMAKEIKNQLL